MTWRLRLGAVVAVLVGVIAVIAWDGQRWDPQHPVLNEVVTSNASTLADAAGEFPDWVEVHNPTGEPFDLGGWFLSDDEGRADRWEFPAVVVEPDGYLVVFASGRDRRDPSGELHTDFRLDREGEAVVLVRPDGRSVADRLAPVGLPRDASFGRDRRDPGRTCFFAFATPGAANAPECFGNADLGAPEFSVASGFFDDPVQVDISAPGDGRIIYTLDGSYPDLVTNPGATMVYEGALEIADRSPQPNTISTVDTTVPSDQVEWDAPEPPVLSQPVGKATVVRARTTYGAERVATYFVGGHLRREGLPVLSLALDEEFLFDPDIGILVAGRTFAEYRASDAFDPQFGWLTPANYHQRGREWERPPADQLRRRVVFEHCRGDGVCDYQTSVGVRLHGNFSRSLPHKSLRLYARNDYGAATFDYPFFGEDAPATHRRLLLRNSGTDAAGTLLLDGYAQSLMTHFHADTQAYQPATLFINGEYWGIHNIRERQDRHYLEAVHGADPDQVVLLGPLLEVAAGEPDAAEAFTDLVARVAAGDPQDPRLLAEVQGELDFDNFFDFLIAHIYMGNRDWPGNNMRLWREPGGPHAVGEGVRDGRWRWLIFDLDQAGESVGTFDVDYNVFEVGMVRTDSPGFGSGVPLLFHRLMENADVRERFLQRFTDHINTTFAPERALARLDELEDLLDEEIVHHSARWDTPSSVSSWRQDLDELRSFMSGRPLAVRRHLRELFDLDGIALLTVHHDPDAGSVRVNTVDIAASTPGVSNPAAWRGIYFTGIPVELEATPAPGYRFVRWQGVTGADASQPQVEVLLDDNTTVEPVFAPAG